MKIIFDFIAGRKNLLFNLALLSLIGGLMLYPPVKQTFEYHFDEGVEAIKASLFLKGYPLYKQIWSDQPPLFTAILAGWFKLLGLEFYKGRVLVLLFLGLLLWTFHQTIKLRQGACCAAAACGFLALSGYFLRLGSSIMIVIPSWALAISSLCLLTLYKSSRTGLHLILSALLMALALQVKFSAALLIPAMLLELRPAAPRSPLPLKDIFRRLSPALSWLILTAAFYSIIVLWFFYPDLNLFRELLFGTHLKRLDLPNNDLKVIANLLFQDFDIFLWAFIGIGTTIRNKNPDAILLLAWICAAAGILSVFRPVWDYYYLFISLPVCWLAGAGVSTWLNRAGKELRSNPFKFFKPLNIPLTGLFLITLLVFPNKVIRAKNSLWGETGPKQKELVERLSREKKRARWLVTDMPAYAFYAGLPVPPEIAAPTIKRRFSNGLTEDIFIGTLKKYQPELLLLGGFQDYPYSVLSFINQNYASIPGSNFSARSNGHLSPLILPPIGSNPVGQYLPLKLRLLLPRKYYGLIWNKLRVPVLLRGIKEREFCSKEIRANIFLRKDLASD